MDIISAIEFDKSGDHLATGDRGGRVVLFERTDTRDVCLFTTYLFFSYLVYFYSWYTVILFLLSSHSFYYATSSMVIEEI